MLREQEKNNNSWFALDTYIWLSSDSTFLWAASTASFWFPELPSLETCDLINSYCNLIWIMWSALFHLCNTCEQQGRMKKKKKRVWSRRIVKFLQLFVYAHRPWRWKKKSKCGYIEKLAILLERFDSSNIFQCNSMRRYSKKLNWINPGFFKRTLATWHCVIINSRKWGPWPQRIRKDMNKMLLGIPYTF